jgi:hypothetical protein
MHARSSAVLLLTDLWRLKVKGVPGIEETGGRRASGEIAMVRGLELPANQRNKSQSKNTLLLLP